MRAFIAIKLPLDIQDALGEIQNKLKLSLPKVTWVKPTKLHLSLKFLGDISFEQLERIQQIIADIIKTKLPFEIRLEILGVFPNYRQAKIIWIGTRLLPPELKQLVAVLEKEFLELGIPQEQHAFQAHITLGRIKYLILPSDLEKGLDKIKNDLLDANLKFTIKGIALFQSRLNPSGPTYSILKEANF
jgi:RNA 2',3'-cyclic 3'-phosphodiesterase